MVNVSFDTKITCPKCGHEFEEHVSGDADIDMSQFAPDHDWR